MGKIRDVNAAMLVAFAHSTSAVADFMGIIPDNLEAVRAALQNSLVGHDLVLLTGGTSVGVKDAVPQVVAELRS